MTGRHNALRISPSIGVKRRIGPASSLPPPRPTNDWWVRLCRPHTYTETAVAVLHMVRLSAISGIVVFVASFLFTLGFIFTGKSPANQTYCEFLLATIAYVSLVLGAAMIIVNATTLSRFHWHKRPDQTKSPLFWIGRLIATSIHHYLLSLACILALTYAIITKAPRFLRQYQFQFYVCGAIINYYTAALDMKFRTLYQSETVEGIASGHRNRRPIWRRLLLAYKKDMGFVVAVFVASLYIHLASRLRVFSQEGLLLFSVSSMAFRSIILKVTQYFVFRMPRVHIRTIYLAAAVPTVLINTQVRILLLRVQASVTWKGVLVLALIEPMMRVYKVWSVKRMQVGRRRQHSPLVPRNRRRANIFPLLIHPNEPVITEKISNRRLTSLQNDDPSQQTQRIVEFAAAEIHADMCSEYIAIACSTSIYFFLRGHPRFSWDHSETPTACESTSCNRDPLWSNALVLLGVQVVVEMVIDFVCSLWELLNGIPIQIGSELQGFMTALYAGCAVTNIAICCAFYVRDDQEPR